MAKSKGAGQPPAGAGFSFPFEHLLYADEGGHILATAYGAAVAPAGAGVPPSALAVATRIAADGMLPPRSASLHALVGGHMISVAGDRTTVHAVYRTPPPDTEATMLLRVALDFESAYGAHLGAAHAVPSTFSAVRGRAERVYADSAKATLAPPKPVQVFVHPELAPRGPGVLVVLRLRNFTREPASGVSVAFSSPKDFLRPAALYGTGAAVDLAAVHLLEPLAPGEKVLELRLEPQEPREGPVRLSLTAPHGVEVECRSLRVAVRFPHLKAPPTDPMVLSRQVALEDDDPRDVFRLRYTRAVSPEFAFERVKEAVARERPLKLLEYSSPAPAYHEAWFLANVAHTGAPLFVEVAVRGPGRLIEVRAATKDLGDLLGAKAEYRRRIRELLSERFMGKRVVVARNEALGPSVEEAAPHLHSALLLKHMQGEIGAAELWHEMRRTATGGSGEGWQFVAGYSEEMDDDRSEGGAKGHRAPRLTGRQAQQELLGDVADTFTRIMAPIVLEQTARMGRPGARLRTGLDRGAEAEAEAAED